MKTMSIIVLIILFSLPLFGQTGDVFFSDLAKDIDCMNLDVTVCVIDSFGWHVPDLVMSDFHFTEDGDPVLPPRITKLNECESYCSDIVLLFDLSGSMDDNVDSFETALAEFAAPLAGLDYRIAMAVFNGCPEQIDGVRILVHTDFSLPVGTTGPDVWATTTDEFNHLFAAVQLYFDWPWSLRGSGWEDQFGALWWAVDTLDWRPGCSKNVVMFTDEEVQVETAPCVPFYDEEDSSLYKIMNYCFAESVTFFAVCPEDSNFEWYPASGDSPDRQYYTGFRELADTTGGIWSDLFASDYSEMVGELAEAIAGPPCCYSFRYMTNFYCVDSITVGVDVTMGTEYFGSSDTSYLSFCQPEILPIIPEFCGGITSCENQRIAGFFENSIYGDLNLTDYIFTVNGDTIDRTDVIFLAESLIYEPTVPFEHMDTVVFAFPSYSNVWNCVGNTPPCTFYVDIEPPFILDHFPAEGDTILINEFEIYGSIWDDFAGIDPGSAGHITVLLDGDTAITSAPVWTSGDTTGFRIDSLITFWDGNVTVCVGGIFDMPDYDYCPSNVMADSCWTFYLATLERLVSFPIMSGAPCETVLVPLEIDDLEYTSLNNAAMTFRVDPTVLVPLDVITLGSVTAGWFVDSLDINPATGDIYAEISGAQISGLTGGGILLYLKAYVPCNAVGGRYCDIEVEDFSFNEGYPMVTWNDGFFMVTLSPNVFFCDIHLNRTVSPSPDDNTLTFGATYSGTDGYDAGLDEVYIPPPDWFVDGWFDIEDSAYPYISQIRRDVKHPTPTVRWHLITRDETDGIARWNPAGLPEGEFRIDSLVDMKRDTQAHFGLNDTLLIEWTLPVIQPDSVQLSIGWNLVSLPVLPAGMSADDVFPTEYGVFHYNTAISSYEFAEEIRDGYGYWVFSNRAHSFLSAGSPLSGYRRQIHRGWNIIGGIDEAIAVSEISMDPSSLIPPIWGWDGSSYISADSILPGHGYWVLSNGEGVLHAPSAYRGKVLNSIEIEREVGIDVLADEPSPLTLCYAPKSSEGLTMGDIAFPPTIPDGEGRKVYLIKDEFALSSALSSTGDWRLVVEVDAEVAFSIPEGVSVSIEERELADGEVVQLRSGIYLLKAQNIELPGEFDVLGCVPNPFNSSTEIVVALPEMGEVSVELYDIIGHKVTTIKRDCSAGISRIRWDGSDMTGAGVSSGLYFVRVSYGTESLSTRVMFIK